MPIAIRVAHAYPSAMTDEPKRKRGPLLRAVIVLQIKLAMSAARDLVLIPLALVAALFDFVRMDKHEPEHFRAMLRLGEQSDRWIDVWHHNDPSEMPRENVDALLTRV